MFVNSCQITIPGDTFCYEIKLTISYKLQFRRITNYNNGFPKVISSKQFNKSLWKVFKAICDVFFYYYFALKLYNNSM